MIITDYSVGQKTAYLMPLVGWFRIIPGLVVVSSPHPRRVFRPGEYTIVGLLTRLSQVPANVRPPENFFDFSYSPGSRRI
jgi:hypothetical protein